MADRPWVSDSTMLSGHFSGKKVVEHNKREHFVTKKFDAVQVIARPLAANGAPRETQAHIPATQAVQ